MKRLKLKRSEVQRYRIAIAAGFLLTLAFPKFDVPGLAWIAPAFMLASAAGFGGAAAFRIGFVAGLAHHLSALYWLLYIPLEFPWKGMVFLGWLALGAYLAIFQGFWTWFGWRICPAKIEPELGFFASIKQLGKSDWSQRAVWTLMVAATWVATEMIQARFLSGFPWGMLGVSQYRMTPLIQISSIVGVYGIAFLLVWFSSALLCAMGLQLSNPSGGRRWAAELFPPVAMAAAVFAFGFHHILAFVKEGLNGRPQGLRAALIPPRQLRAALIQPSIPQTMIWDEREAMTRFHQVLDWSDKALAEKPRPELLVWPEAAVPNIFRWDTNLYDGKTMFDWITGFAREHQIWLVMGADDADPKEGVSTNYFNSSFLVNPAGEVVSRYRKRRLVIFGEYVPFSKWLPFLGAMVQSEGEFTPGDQPVSFHLRNAASPSPPPGDVRGRDLNVTTSVLICFEDVFPHLVREYVDKDTDFLLNLTNNGWFGESAAQWQHAASAVFRAVENNIPLVRCANNGLTCWLDRRGNMHDVYFPGSKDIYKAGYKIVDIPVGTEGKYVPTFYRSYGDVFGWLCVGVTGVALMAGLIRERSSSRREEALIDREEK